MIERSFTDCLLVWLPRLDALCNQSFLLIASSFGILKDIVPRLPHDRRALVIAAGCGLKVARGCRCQEIAAARPSGLQYASPITCGHAVHETVCAATGNTFGLKRPLGHDTLRNENQVKPFGAAVYYTLSY